MEKYEFIDLGGRYICNLHVDSIIVCSCKINTENDIWSISSWYTIPEYGNKGYGKKTMAALIKHMYDMFGVPLGIEYIWNGANQYVYDWIEKNFEAVCECSMSVMKYQCEDDWESHIYKLNKDKFLSYFHIN